VIVCLRTVAVPAEWREQHLAWIAESRNVRQAHGILGEHFCEPSPGQEDTVVVTLWPDHETFDAWIATPERDALTASAVHQAVDYRPITRCEVTGGYLNADCTRPTRPMRRTHEVGDPRPPEDRPHAIGLGGLDVEADDHRLLERASFVYDALYAWCTQQLTTAPA
jgi:heme-degrading monooxygenase HmoA